MEDKVVGQVFSFPYPQPFNIPGLLGLVPELSSTCNEFYLYSASNGSVQDVNKII